eukprot:TRINITY_DN85_c0_g1_i12.p1 TRINITY_DN85_c0_g1~~TRINITY_DN85_c0_g1_i12.p1  ORF type:complete len:195 (-),score=59.39 TRINITY_DN85_c0_g1_i12:630-1214(-)
MNNDYSTIKSLKICAVGDGATGKTSLLIRYTLQKFEDDYCPTVFDNYSCNVLVDKQIVNLSLWDTAGQEDYDRLRPLSYPLTDVFVVCYSVLSKASLANVSEKWIPEITHHNPGTPWILVGNKTDLRRGSSDSQVSTEQGEKAAKSLGAAGFIETSALTGNNTTELFEQCIRTCFKDAEDKKMAGKKQKKCLLL